VRKLIVLLALSVACNTLEKPPQTGSVAAPPESSVDLTELKSRLKMNRNIHELGFRETRFERNSHLVVIHFRMLCRESEGTVDEVSRSDLLPIESNSVRWKLGSSDGYTRTDRDGFGQVETIHSKSASRDRLRLTIDGRFVAVPAAEAGLVVVPGSWCSR
jgi:hypothetical protein